MPGKRILCIVPLRKKGAYAATGLPYRLANDHNPGIAMKPLLLLTLSLFSAAVLTGQDAKIETDKTLVGEPAKRGPAEWTVLFSGKDLNGWMDANGGASKWVVENGAMSGQKGSGDVWTKARYGNFILEVEFKTTGNSGVFFRTDNPKDPVQTGIEIQVDNPGGPNKHSVGAIYDLVPPTKNAGKKDDWNKFVITVQESFISVELNGEKIAKMDLNQWTEARKNPDGSENKFTKALKDWKREGHIGFQDHGNKVWYRNVRIKAMP